MIISFPKIKFTYNHKPIAKPKKQELASNKQTTQEKAKYDIPYEAYYLQKPQKSPLLEEGQMSTEKGEIINRHTTGFFRADMDWAEFGKYLKEKYPSIDDVDFITYACSTGEEPYSLALLLNKLYGKNTEIKAFDLSDDVINDNIKKQQEGIFVNMPTIRYICEDMNTSDIDAFEDGDYKGAKIKRNITDSVSFDKANILTSLDNIDSEKPTVLMARNMWPYVNPEKYHQFAKELYEKLAPNSIFILGLYDYEGNPDVANSYTFPDVLLEEGFKRIQYSKYQPNGIGSLVFEK